MMELHQALKIVLNSARPLGSERVDLDHAMNGVLAEDVVSDLDMPPFDRSMVDGYACRRVDLAGELSVVETIQAGVPPAKTIGPRQCAKIMTGAAVPQGVDCVVMVEQTEPVGHDAIRCRGRQAPDNICRRADDVKAGQVVLKKGDWIRPQHVAVLASVGCIRPLVARRPKVAVVATGDELVEPTVKPGPSQLRNSNTSQLAAQLNTVGVSPSDYGVVKDIEADIDRVLSTALAENDVVLISGGVSVGDFDFVPGALRRNRVKLLFERIAVKPGKPTLFGLSEHSYCFGLPGNPVSAFVMFELLVRPFLFKLMGHVYSPVRIEMRLDEPIARKDTERQSWIPVKLTCRTAVKPLEYHSSAHSLALCEADGLVPVDIGLASIEKGASVQVLLL
jgi:molybdopterin molybdotransferase